MSEVQKIVVLTESELESVIKRAVAEALKTQNGKDNMLTANEAADFLSYSRDWVYRNWQRIGGRKVGRRGIRFRREDLEAWAASRKG